MVARLIEGWESSTVLADYAGKWTSLTGTATISSTAGRFGNGLRATGTTVSVQRTFDNQATWVVGCAVRYGAAPSANISWITLLDTAVVHCGVGITDTTGQVFAFRATTATVLGTSALALTQNAWYYLELKATIGDAPTGSLTVRVNGTAVLTLTGIDTRNAGNATANVVRLGQGGGTCQTDFDDIYIFDATGTVNTDFAGDCRVQAVLPTGAGATTAWTPSAGSNFACVDDAPPNADTDYVSSATAGQTDTYAFGDLAVASGTVKAVQATAVARKDDAGSRSLALVARPGGTDRLGATQGVSSSYAGITEVWNTNPDTAAPWTVAETNASQFGQRLIA